MTSKSLLAFLFYWTLCTSAFSNDVEYLASSPDSSIFVFDTVYLEAIGKNYEINKNVTEYQSIADMGGNTSVRNVHEDEIKWKSQGYFQRNRDLGQLFIPKKDTKVKSIVMRTGPAESAVLYNTPGAKVFVQFFTISGTPLINDNGTPKGTESTHGFNTNHRTDDYIEGVEYESFPTIYTGAFPLEVPITKDENGNPTNNDGRLFYIRWTFKEAQIFKANQRYGFMMGLLEPGFGQGFTMANANRAAMGDIPSLDDRHTPYKGGWSFRREGDGTLPPTMFPRDNPPGSDSLVQILKSESLFGEADNRFLLSPTSDGFPDVDTYRAFEFYIEEESDYVEMEGLDLPVDSISLKVGEAFTLLPVFIPENASNQEVNWFTSSPAIAEVDSNGRVLAKDVGNAAISVISAEGYFNATCLVKVENSATSNKELSSKDESLKFFPNPVTGTLLNIESDQSVIHDIQLFSLDGKMVLRQKLNSKKAALNVSKLPGGLYIVKVKTGKGSSMRKIVIEN